MATLSSTGRFAAGEACADNDILYGPYATTAAAHAALLNAEQNVVGRTVGIQTGNIIEEYWYQGGTDQANLVKKQTASVEVDSEPIKDSSNPVSSGGVYTALQEKANASDIPSVPTISTNIESDANSDTKTTSPKAVKTYVDGKVSSAYKAAGTASSVSNLGSLDASHEGFVYNMSAAFTTTADFVEGSGKTYPAGTNVSIVNVGTAQSPSYKYDVMAGFVDLNNYVPKSPNAGLLKNDGSIDSQTAGKAASALQPKQSGQYTQGNIVVFDANGGLADSQKKTTDFAPIAQAVPTPQSGDEGKILGYETQGGVQWVTRPQDGQDGASGKSAYQLYVDGGGDLSQEDWLASLKANIGAFKFVANVPAVETAFETDGIGTPYISAIDNISAGQDTLSVILLMNTANASPAKTYMIATQEAATAGTYEFIYAGDLQSAMQSNVLIEDDIVDNLTSTDTDKALSANQGKVLKDELDARTLDSITESMTHEEVLQQVFTSLVYKATPDSIGKTLSEVAVGSISTFNTYKIEISEYTGIKFKKIVSSQGWGSLIIDENNIVLGAYTYTDNTVPYAEVQIMEGAKYFYYACLKAVDATEWTFEGIKQISKIDNLSEQVESLSENKIAYSDIYDGLDSDDATKVLSAKQGKVLNDELYETTINETQATSYQKYFTSSALKATEDVIGENITNVEHGFLANLDTYKIPIDSYDRIEFLSFNSSQGYGSVITNEEGVVLAAFYNIESLITYSYDVVEGAKYLYYGINKNNASSYIVKGFKVASKFDEIESKLNILPKEFSIQASNANSIKPYLFQGKVSNSSIIEDGQFVTTSPIFGNFYIKLNEDYRVYSSALVNAKGDIIADSFLSNLRFNGDNMWVGRTNYGVYNMPSGYGVLVTFIKVDSNNNIMSISVSDCIIRKFEWLTDEKTPRLLPEIDVEYYNAAWKRSRALQKLVFTPLLKLPARGSLDGTFYIKDKTYVGIPYSGARFYEKFVGVDVAIRTFISSLYNLHSLMYTENLRTNAHHSEYGFTYPNDSEASTYYGVVCSAFVAYVLGKGIVIPSNTPTVLGLTKVTNYTSISDVKPLDVIVTYGHISIITDILKDSKGNPKYICWAEATSPLTKITPYSFEDFMERFNSEKGADWPSSGFYRYSNWADNISLEVEDTTNLVEVENDDYVYGRKFNDDICTFAGDYAAFREGQTIFLNVKPKDIYTKIIIRKENAADVEIDITSATIVDGIADIDITNQSLTDGIYIAFLQNSDGSVSSEPTHFEVLKAIINATSSGGNSYNITFDYDSGVPYAVCHIDSRGVVYAYHKLTDTEISNKACSLTGSYNNFRLYVKGEYGVICNQVTAS